MPKQAQGGLLLPRWLVATGAACVLIAMSPLVSGLIGWGEGRDLARFDPLLSLCLASRPGVQPEHLWASWSFAPQILLPWLAVALLYGRGALAPEGLRDGRPKPGEVGVFIGAMVLLAAALLSPLCRLAATLAWAHMIQHILIVAVVPPMLIIGRPLVAARPSLPGRWRAAADLDGDAARGWLDRPALAFGVYAAAIWLSHAPAVYQGALVDPTIHLLLLLFQLSAGLLFWRIIIGCVTKAERRQDVGAALLMTFLTFMHTGLLGALLTFASWPLYPIYELRAHAWGLTPLEDQQLAGLIMWVPMSTIFLAAVLVVMAQLLRLREPHPG